MSQQRTTLTTRETEAAAFIANVTGLRLVTIIESQTSARLSLAIFRGIFRDEDGRPVVVSIVEPVRQ